MKAAIRDNTPCSSSSICAALPTSSEELPEGDYICALDQAEVSCAKAADVTILTYSRMRTTAFKPSKQLEAEGRSMWSLIDLISLQAHFSSRRSRARSARPTSEVVEECYENRAASVLS